MVIRKKASEIGAQTYLSVTPVATDDFDEQDIKVECSRGVQTITKLISEPEYIVVAELEFVSPEEIKQNSDRIIDLPKKTVLQFNLPTSTLSIPIESQTEDIISRIKLPVISSESVKVKNMASSESQFPKIGSGVGSALGLEMELSNMRMKSNIRKTHHYKDLQKTFTDGSYQTDIGVSPHILQDDEIANVCTTLATQTSLTFVPRESPSKIGNLLKTRLSHSKNAEQIIAISPERLLKIVEAKETESTINDIVKLDKVDGKPVPNTSMEEKLRTFSAENEMETRIKSILNNTVSYLENRLEHMLEKYGDIQSMNAIVPSECVNEISQNSHATVQVEGAPFILPSNDDELPTEDGKGLELPKVSIDNSHKSITTTKTGSSKVPVDTNVDKRTSGLKETCCCHEWHQTYPVKEPHTEESLKTKDKMLKRSTMSTPSVPVTDTGKCYITSVEKSGHVRLPLLGITDSSISSPQLGFCHRDILFSSNEQNNDCCTNIKPTKPTCRSEVPKSIPSEKIMKPFQNNMISGWNICPCSSKMAEKDKIEDKIVPSTYQYQTFEQDDGVDTENYLDAILTSETAATQTDVFQILGGVLQEDPEGDKPIEDDVKCACKPNFDLPWDDFALKPTKRQRDPSPQEQKVDVKEAGTSPQNNPVVQDIINHLTVERLNTTKHMNLDVGPDSPHLTTQATSSTTAFRPTTPQEAVSVPSVSKDVPKTESKIPPKEPKMADNALYDDNCGRHNEPYMEKLYRYYPDDCDETNRCTSGTEMPWNSLLLPRNIRIRKTYRPEGLPSTKSKPQPQLQMSPSLKTIETQMMDVEPKCSCHSSKSKPEFKAKPFDRSPNKERIERLLLACKKEMEPIKDGINKLRERIRELNLPDLGEKSQMIPRGFVPQQSVGFSPSYQPQIGCFTPTYPPYYSGFAVPFPCQNVPQSTKSTTCSSYSCTTSQSECSSLEELTRGRKKASRKVPSRCSCPVQTSTCSFTPCGKRSNKSLSRKRRTNPRSVSPRNKASASSVPSRSKTNAPKEKMSTSFCVPFPQKKAASSRIPLRVGAKKKEKVLKSVDLSLIKSGTSVQVSLSTSTASVGQNKKVPQKMVPKPTTPTTIRVVNKIRVRAEKTNVSTGTI